ncbi:hypothetical protein [Aquimarina algiphila]|uniref:Uncharacterized protein n=1 Tax=Aquimarina algiphila TaxID=2047982 RepID=A0A554VRT2_9FLAO|nr:hypothetical protein [Aquimarina algiphila]TSE11338.1 hypothetical protein FOF46_01530 [Aquimarina algiphila]
MKILLRILLTALICTSCNSDDDGGNSAIRLELKSAASIGITNPKFTILVYGFDNSYADVAATLISTQNFESNQLPVTITLTIPPNPESMIELNTSNRNISYYINIEWDNDNNGKICNGDISIDYNTETNFINLNPLVTQEVFVSEIKALPCE